MSNFSLLKSVLAVDLQGRVTDVQVKRGNELHCRIGRAVAPKLAEVLRREFQTELTLMVATDRRADKGHGMSVHD